MDTSNFTDENLHTGPSQMERLTNSQVMNSAGGYVWELDDLKRFVRFLCLGTEGGTYYVTEQKLTLENCECVARISESNKWQSALEELVKCSTDGRAAKQNPTLFALAFFCRQTKNKELKTAAYKVVSDVCRIPTHLFQFLEYCQKLSGNGKGWGRAHRNAITKWYLGFEEDPLRLAMHVTKYRTRCGWSHVDVLRLCHPKPKSAGVGAVIRYVVKGREASEADYLKEDGDEVVKKVFTFLNAVDSVHSAKTSTEILQLIEEHHLAREHIPTPLLDDVPVWKTLLPHMPMTAMIRNLNKLSKLGLLGEGSAELETVVSKLGDDEFLRKARIHPFNILVALTTYKAGRGERGKLEWVVSKAIVNALDSAFYKCFKFVEPTNKRYLLAIDVSGSMSCPVLGSPCIQANCAAAAMAMVTLQTEKLCEVVAFSDTLVPVKLKSKMKLAEVMSKLGKIPMGSTDCALPITWAMSLKKKFDVFIVYTDNETWFGRIHPAQALKKYRRKVRSPDVKLIVVGMTSTSFTIADPEDGRMLDVCGFDSAAPEVMRNFVMGLI